MDEYGKLWTIMDGFFSSIIYGRTQNTKTASIAQKWPFLKLWTLWTKKTGNVCPS
jgi:hypothetical protein